MVLGRPRLKDKKIGFVDNECWINSWYLRVRFTSLPPATAPTHHMSLTTQGNKVNEEIAMEENLEVETKQKESYLCLHKKYTLMLQNCSM